MFILTQDDSGHWYVVPKEREGEFRKWVANQEEYWVENLDNQQAGECLPQPEWAERVNGSPSLVVFPSYWVSG